VHEISITKISWRFLVKLFRIASYHGQTPDIQTLNMKMVTLLSIVVLMLGASLLGNAQQAANTINTVAGGGTTPTNPLLLDLPGPTSVIKDVQGNLYIAAPASAYVFELLSSGTVQNYAGLGWGYFAGDGGAPTAANLGQPTSFAIDKQGNFYIADIGTSRIREISNGIINTVVGSGAKCDIAQGTNVCGDGGAALQANLNIPSSIALDSAGNIYITDTVDNRIRVANMGASTITIAGTTIPAGDIQTIVGDGNACNIATNPTCGDGGPASAAEVNLPQGVFVDGAGNIYIADTKDQEIRVILAGQSTIKSYAGQTGAACPLSTSRCNDGGPATSGLLHLPQGIFIDANGNGYVSDTADNRIRYVNAQTGNISTIAGNGAQGFAGDGSTAASAELDLPASVFVDTTGNIYVSDTGNQRIREFTSGANIQTVAGGSLGDGPALSAQLALPYSVAEDSSGNVYFADQANNRVRKLTNSGGSFSVSTIVGTGSVGWSGDGGAATLATLNAPSYVTLDNFGNLYITDTNNLVIRQVNLTTNVISTVAGTAGSSCSPTTAKCGDEGPAIAATFTGPLGISVNSAGNLIIADYYGYRVRAVNTSKSSAATIAGIPIQPGAIATIAGTGSQGDCSFRSACNGPAINLGLNHPGATAADSAGNIYLSDQWNNSVRVVSPTGIMTNYALGGKAGLIGDGGPASKGGMWNPLLVTLDPAGNLFISGGNDNVVQRVDVSSTGVGGPHEIGTVAGSATHPTIGGFGGDGASATSSGTKMSNLGSSVNAQGSLYIADGGNNRIRYVPLAPAAASSVSTLSLGTWAIGQLGQPRSLTFSSTGGADLSLSSISITGANSSEFTQTNTCGTLPTTIGPNANCAVTATLTPSGYGKQTATLSFTDNGPNSPQTVTLSGSGPDFSTSVSPTSLTLVRGAAGTSTISLTPIARFSQTVNLTVSGCPSNTTCTISPSQVTLTGGSVSTTTLTVQTQTTTPIATSTLVITSTFQNLVHISHVALKVTK
jgi:sugar lactone lactonase YvrE